MRPGRVVANYIFETPIGEGGMAVVWRVRHQTLARRFALKLLTIHNPHIEERLLQEGRLQASLRHPHIVAAVDTVQVDQSLGLVMEYVEGPSLAEWLDAYQPTTDESLAVFRGIVAGVGAAHAQGLIHRDLKPGNVMLAVEEQGLVPKVTDFGLAKSLKSLDPRRTRTGTTMGTPQYMAPEQIRDASSVDRRADLYSLGAILFELLCGRPPYIEPDVIELFVKVAAGDRPTARELRPDIPEHIDDLIEWLLTTNANKRLANCDTLLSLLDGGDASLEETQSEGGLTTARPVPGGILGSIPRTSPGYAIAERFVAELISVPPADPTLADPPLTTDTASAPPDRGRGIAMLLAVVVFAIGLVVIVLTAGGAGAAIATWLGGTGTTVDPPPVSEPAPDVPDPAPVLEAPAPAPEEPAPQPTAQPDPTPEPAPVAAPQQPQPAPTSDPRPEPRPDPVVPAPTPAPAPMGRFEVTARSGHGDVYLRSATGDVVRPGERGPPGSYNVWVDWSDYGLRQAGTAVLEAGEVLRMTCYAERTACRVE